MLDLSNLAKINDRADLTTCHPDSLPWPTEISASERAFYARVCGYGSGGEREASAYVAKELAQLADIERHVSICLGVLSGAFESSRLLRGSALVGACMHFAAEEYQHSNMFYRYVELLAGTTIDASHKTLSGRLALYLGPESVESKLVALLGTAYPGESVITVFEHRLRKFDPKRRMFLTKMLHAHGLDEARHIEFDHFVFDGVLPQLTDAELADAQRIYGKTMEYNHVLGQTYGDLARRRFDVDFARGNAAAEIQLALTMAFARKTLSGRTFPRADDALTPAERDMFRTFTGAARVHSSEDPGS
jgi:hypothetical protein